MGENSAESRPPKQEAFAEYIMPLERWLPEGHLLPTCMKPVANQITNLPIRQNDVWVVTFPKCGTTWMQEIAWLLTHQLDYETARKQTLNQRSPFLEYAIEISLLPSGQTIPGMTFEKTINEIDKLQSPRIIKTHLCWSRLPEKLREANSPGKIIYVARNPRDVCISMYHFFRLLEPKEIYSAVTDSLDNFYDRFITDKLIYTPYWSHVLEFWDRRDNPNILFLTYEEMKLNLTNVIEKLTTFLGVPQPTPQQMPALLDHLSFSKMKDNDAVNKKGSKYFKVADEQHPGFMRKGIVGEWKEKLSEEWKKRFDEWIQQNTRRTDFPHYL